MKLCERCKDVSYCRKFAGEDIKPYFIIQIDDKLFADVVPLRLPNNYHYPNIHQQCSEALDLFHAKEYALSLEILQNLKTEINYSGLNYAMVCCLYYTKQYQEAMDMLTYDNYDYVMKGPLSERFSSLMFEACETKINELAWLKEQEERSKEISEVQRNSNLIAIVEKHQNAVVKAIEQMDIQKLLFLLNPKIKYEKYAHISYIILLDNLFDELYSSGDKQLVAHKLTCSCNNESNKTCYRFIGEQFEWYFNMVIQYENGQLSNLYICEDELCSYSSVSPANRVSLYKNFCVYEYEFFQKILGYYGPFCLRNDFKGYE